MHAEKFAVLQRTNLIYYVNKSTISENNSFERVR
jgi:hypothetical protein